MFRTVLLHLLFRSVFFVLIVCSVAPVQIAQAEIFDAQETTLQNGMRVVFIPNHRTPAATHMVWIKAGSVDEPAGVAGLAHFLEHLLFKGTKSHGPGEFSRIVKSFGAVHNAFTSKDYTAYFETVPIDRLEDVMRLNADRMQNLSPPAKEVSAERLVVLEERRMRVDNDPAAQFEEYLRAARYLTHPYARPVIGWHEELKRINWDNALEFYRKWYVPNNMILIVTGDTTFDEVVALAKKHYGVLRKRQLPDRLDPVLPKLAGQALLTHRDENIFQPRISRLYIAPSYADNKQESLALQVVEEIISGAPSTYLHQKLVKEQKLASSISAYYAQSSRYETLIYLSALPMEGVPLPKLDRALTKALNDLYEKDLTVPLVEQAKKRLIAKSAYARDSLSGPAMIAGRALITGTPLSDVEKWDKLIGKVTPAQVKLALDKYLVSPRLEPVTGYTYPSKKKKEPVTHIRSEKEQPEHKQEQENDRRGKGQGTQQNPVPEKLVPQTPDLEKPDLKKTMNPVLDEQTTPDKQKRSESRASEHNSTSDTADTAEEEGASESTTGRNNDGSGL